MLTDIKRPRKYITFLKKEKERKTENLGFNRKQLKGDRKESRIKRCIEEEEINFTFHKFVQ